MRSTPILLTALFLLALLSNFASAADVTSPNIVFVMADDK